MKLLKILALILIWPMVANAEDASFVVTGGGDSAITGNLANEDGLTYNRNYYINTAVYDAQRIGAVITYSSVTYANVTFSTNAYSAGSCQITIANHGLTLGVPVIARVTSGNIPPVLTAETTYYAGPIISENIVCLSTTLAQAQINDPVLFTSSKPAVGTQTYTLVIASPSIVGYPTFTYSGSNDGTNFFSLGVSSVTTEWAATGKSWNYDFSYYNYNTLKLAVVSPTAGAVKFKSILSIKRH